MERKKPTQEKSKRRPSYGDLSLDDVRKNFNLAISRPGLFEVIEVIEPSKWLQEVLEEGFEVSVVSEKARSEFIVAPILLYIRELHKGKVSIYSGVKFDVDPEKGLQGTCDFILSKSPVLPTVQAPAFIVVEAKKNDIEEGLGQCVAEMVAAQIFNKKEGHEIPSIYGCVTTGESWQFLRLAGKNLEIDKNRYFIVKLGEILGILNTIVKDILRKSDA
jgi:hypothetical protein